MKANNKNIGKIGEAAASLYLQKLGYSLITSNFSTRYGEIDLIFMDREQMVFVEVKAKKTLIFGTPEEMFTRYKYNKVKGLAQVYLKGKEINCRIDMVAVEINFDDSVKVLRHYKNVIY